MLALSRSICSGWIVCQFWVSDASLRLPSYTETFHLVYKLSTSYTKSLRKVASCITADATAEHAQAKTKHMQHSQAIYFVLRVQPIINMFFVSYIFFVLNDVNLVILKMFIYVVIYIWTANNKNISTIIYTIITLLNNLTERRQKQCKIVKQIEIRINISINTLGAHSTMYACLTISSHSLIKKKWQIQIYNTLLECKNNRMICSKK